MFEAPDPWRQDRKHRRELCFVVAPLSSRSPIESASDLRGALAAAIYYRRRVLKLPHGFGPFDSNEITYRFDCAIEIVDHILVANCANLEERRILPHRIHEIHDSVIEARAIIEPEEFKACRRHVEAVPERTQYDIARVADGKNYSGRRE
jgi:hypothetical protein